MCCDWGVSVLASVRDEGFCVDVGLVALELSGLSVVSSYLGISVIDSFGARPRGWCVVLGCMVFAACFPL
jgi:hypothetical protein